MNGPKNLSLGARGRYAILRKIADGGMAEIFLANQIGAEGFERPVIIKRILPGLSADPVFKNMLVDEAHVAMSLGHSNIVQVLDLGQWKARYFLVLDLVDGWDLATVLDRARQAGVPFPLPLALHVVAQVCRGLAYAHGKTRDGKALGIVHRDVSPQNVLISEQGEVKVTDFGIAKAMIKREHTAAGVIKGKLDFMSPEQASGAALDARSDIFSTGSMLYLICVGRRPFSGPTELEALMKVQKAEFEPPGKVNPDLPRSITRLIEKAMQKAPSKRHRNAEELMLEIEDVLKTDFRMAGQSDLKKWLDELRRKDGSPMTSQRPGLHIEDPDLAADGKTILALEDTSAVSAFAETRQSLPAVPYAQSPAAPAAGPAYAQQTPERPHARAPRRRSLLRPLALMAALAGAIFAVNKLYAPQWPKAWVDKGKTVASDVGQLLGMDPAKPGPARRPAVAKKTSTPARPAAMTPVTQESPAPSSPAGLPEPKGGAPVAPPRDDVPARAVRLRIDSTPRAAIVTGPRGRAGKTPLSLATSDGAVLHLTLSKAGYETEKRRVVVDASKPSLTVKLERSPAKKPRGRWR
jgi:serine/threonine-protein kinase